MIVDEILTDEKQDESKLGDILLKEVKHSKKKIEAMQLCQFIIKHAEANSLEIKDKFDKF